MGALTVTLGADITSLRRAMAGATQLVADSAMKMASMSVVGLKVGLGAALASGASALAGGIKAVTSAANFEQKQVAFGTLIGDVASPRPTSRPPSSASNNKAGNWKPPKWIPCRASPEKSRAPLRRTRLPSRPSLHPGRRIRPVSSDN